MNRDYLATRGKALERDTAPNDPREMADLIDQKGLTEDYLDERAKEMQPAAPGPRPQTLDEQIKYMREHPEEREKWLATASFETKPKEAIRQLLRDENAPVSQAYESMKEEGIPTGEAAHELAKQQLERQEADPLLRKQRLQRSLANAAELNKQDDEERGTAGIAREQLGAILDSTGVSGGRKLAEKISFEAKTGFGQVGAIDELIESVERRQEELEHPMEEETNLFKRFLGIGEHGGQFHERAQTVEENKQAETLAGILPVLREIAAEAKKTNELQQKQLIENAEAHRADQANHSGRAMRGTAANAKGVE